MKDVAARLADLRYRAERLAWRIGMVAAFVPLAWLPSCVRCGWRHTGDCWDRPCARCGMIHTGDVAC